MKKFFSLLIALILISSGCSNSTGWEIVQQNELGTKYKGETISITGELIEKELFGEKRVLFEVSEESKKQLPTEVTQTQFYLQENIEKPHEELGKELEIRINQVSIMTEGSPSLGLTDSMN